MISSSHRLGHTLFVPVLTGLVLVFLLIPTLLVIPVSLGSEKYLTFPPTNISFKWYAAYFSDPEWMHATQLSLVVASLATIISTLVAVPATLAFGRGRLPMGSGLRALMLAPMILPHIVIAVAMYITFSRWNLVGSVTGFVVAHSVLCVPFLFLTLSSAVAKLDPSLELAAMSLGASRLSVFRHITLPILWPSIAGGMAFAFITSLDEAVVSIFLSSSTQKVIAKKMFEDIDFDLSPIIAAVSTMILLASLTVIGAMLLWRRFRTPKV